MISFNEIQEKFQFHKNELEILNRRKDELTQELTELSAERELAKKTDAAFEELIRRLNKSSIESVENLVSRGLTVIFENPFEFKIKVGTKRGNLSYSLFLLDNNKETDIMDSYGGGVVSIVSILLRIVTIVTLDLQKVLVLDESLAQLSREYTENAAQFLKQLGKDLEFTIIMVTHDHSYTQFADKVYEVKKPNHYSTLKEINNV